MKPLRRPVFLAHNPYRRRRLRDAARLLPVVGAFLMILPMLWSPAGSGSRLLSGDVIWFFLIWALLILAAAALAPGLARSVEEEGEAGPERSLLAEPRVKGRDDVL
ncbi:hypothetical protein [Pseudogemmobacter faecipullorum]|uniref:DUF3311 domain-containing protein n=1 Tax=Pseudogemmobacter faecipullorum TaxID=2755041 RepID=A0ABS8CLI0_9RHOB|nr:hypothetical protein [Pseudogemmobacter faecipullorum]MCB5409730.1 hypothetical protein [Pseudogemmobacter faecipullorum]